MMILVRTPGDNILYQYLGDTLPPVGRVFEVLDEDRDQEYTVQVTRVVEHVRRTPEIPGKPLSTHYATVYVADAESPEVS